MHKYTELYDKNSIQMAAKLSVAPMMDRTDRHCRYFHRLFSRNALLYTEMITSKAIVKGDANQLLKFNEMEHPVALQLGGADPLELAEAAKIGADFGYDEINLNVGCPSDRVQSGKFGAILMKEPSLVAECCSAIKRSVDLEVTVKCRLGVDNQNTVETLPQFLKCVSGSGVKRFVIHARKAWLKGLSPKANREIPPLNYNLVQKMQILFPKLHISINGGIESLESAQKLLSLGLRGVMIGRAAYKQPTYILSEVDKKIFGEHSLINPIEVVESMLPYIEEQLAKGEKLSRITRHMLGIFNGKPGARIWRRLLSESSNLNSPKVLLKALAEIKSSPSIDKIN